MSSLGMLRQLQNASRIPASARGGTFNPVDVARNLGGLGVGGAILQMLGLQGSTPQGPPSQRLRQGRAEHAGRTGMYGRYDFRLGAPATPPPAPVLPPPASYAGPAERAYQTEKSRVAQLTAQDPELQRYENARKAAVAPGATPEQVQSAEDIGMQIWAKKYGKTLAEKVKPGQSGYEAIQRLQGTGSMGSPLNLPFDTSSPLGTTPPVSPASYESGQVAQGLGLSALPGNAFAGASAAPYAAFNQGPTLQSAPLGIPAEIPSASYDGVQGIQPVGSPVEKFNPKGEEAQKLLEMFKNSIFNTQA